jgi:hypothetical protein
MAPGHGIPEAADKYDVTRPRRGLKVSERDKPLIDKILAAAHGIATRRPTS